MENLITNKTIERLKYDLVREELISFENLQLAEQHAEQKGQTLVHSLTVLKILSEKALLEFIQTKLRIPFVHLDDYSLDIKCINFITKKDALKLKILPLFKIEDVLTVAMSDPLDLFSVNAILKTANLNIEPVVCSENSILRAINKYYTETCSYSQIKVESKNWKNRIEGDCFDSETADLFLNDIINYAIAKEYYDISINEHKDKLHFSFQDLYKSKTEDNIPILVAPLLYTAFKTKLETIYDENHNFINGGFNYSVNCNEYFIYLSKINHNNGKQTIIKIYPLTPAKNNLNIKKVEKLLNKKGIIALCSKSDISRVSFVYSALLNIDLSTKTVFTAENFIKKPIENACQNKFDFLPGADLGKLYKIAKFHSADIIWIEGCLSFDILNYLTLLIEEGKTIIVEFNSENKEELTQQLDQHDFAYMKNYILDYIQL
jgi:type IV pilus assembly protein PilB